MDHLKKTFFKRKDDDMNIPEAMAHLSGYPFFLTASGTDKSHGVLAEFVMPCANTPAMLMISVRKGMALSPLIRDSRMFTVAAVDGIALAHARRLDQMIIDQVDSFMGISVEHTPTGIPVLTGSLAWFECELSRHIDIDADCELYAGIVRAAHMDETYQAQLEGEDSSLTELLMDLTPTGVG